jgi:peptide/nickel transport system substrate-binding protein
MHRRVLRSAWSAKRAGLLIVALALILGCRGAATPESPPAATTPQRGGTAILGSITDMDSWNEYVSRQSFANYVLRRVFLRLAQEAGQGEDGPGTFTPVLAESWEPSDDGLSITFRLREAMWSDGKPITADDVRFTWQAQTSEHVPWINAEAKERITDVAVVDDRTVVFRFDRLYAYQLADAVEGGILPRHVFEAVPFEEWATHDWSRTPIGSGPFLLERHEPGQQIVLKRNPHYLEGESPMLDRVVVRIVPDVLSLLTQLRSGEIDFLMGVPPRDAYRMSSDPDAEFQIEAFQTPRYEYLGWNCARPPFDDPMLRRAITLAIDREALVEDLVYEYGSVSSRPVPSFWWGAAEDLEPWPYDPDTARTILSERGYATLAADGTQNEASEKLEFDLATNVGNRLRADTLVKIQEQLSRIGVTVNVHTMEQRALIQQASAGEFDAYLGGWNFQGKVPLKILFGSDYTPPNGFNVVQYRDAEVDRDLESLDHVAEWQEMKPILDAIQRRIHADQPYTFLFERDEIAAYGPRLHGVTIDLPSDPLARLERFWVASPQRSPG